MTPATRSTGHGTASDEDRWSDASWAEVVTGLILAGCWSTRRYVSARVERVPVRQRGHPVLVADLPLSTHHDNDPYRDPAGARTGATTTRSVGLRQRVTKLSTSTRRTRARGRVRDRRGSRGSSPCRRRCTRDPRM